MKKVNGMFLLKIVVAVAGAGVTLAQTYFDKIELDKKVSEKVTEALKEQVKGS